MWWGEHRASPKREWERHRKKDCQRRQISPMSSHLRPFRAAKFHFVICSSRAELVLPKPVLTGSTLGFRPGNHRVAIEKTIRKFCKGKNHHNLDIAVVSSTLLVHSLDSNSLSLSPSSLSSPLPAHTRPNLDHYSSYHNVQACLSLGNGRKFGPKSRRTRLQITSKGKTSCNPEK